MWIPSFRHNEKIFKPTKKSFNLIVESPQPPICNPKLIAVFRNLSRIVGLGMSKEQRVPSPREFLSFKKEKKFFLIILYIIQSRLKFKN